MRARITKVFYWKGLQWKPILILGHTTPFVIEKGCFKDHFYKITIKNKKKHQKFTVYMAFVGEGVVKAWVYEDTLKKFIFVFHFGYIRFC